MRTVAAAVCLFFALCALAVEPLVLRVGTLAMQFPDGWTFQGGKQRAEGKGPDGEAVIVTYRVLVQGAPPEAVEQHWKAVRGFAADKLPEIAAKNGEVLRPPAEVALPGGRVQFSTVSQGKRLLRDYYFLQYLLGSSRALVFLTVEGFGSATEASGRFDQILATQQWDE